MAPHPLHPALCPRRAGRPGHLPLPGVVLGVALQLGGLDELRGALRRGLPCGDRPGPAEPPRRLPCGAHELQAALLPARLHHPREHGAAGDEGHGRLRAHRLAHPCVLRHRARRPRQQRGGAWGRPRRHWREPRAEHPLPRHRVLDARRLRSQRLPRRARRRHYARRPAGHLLCLPLPRDHRPAQPSDHHPLRLSRPERGAAQGGVHAHARAAHRRVPPPHPQHPPAQGRVAPRACERRSALGAPPGV
mmetsp:Transcript_199/g.568  ORF Transcript_199/g.568 Transcript_199/m.568 type:complete len:248 (-) Transcript_199:406-1149(-)